MISKRHIHLYLQSYFNLSPLLTIFLLSRCDSECSYKMISRIVVDWSCKPGSQNTIVINLFKC